MLSPADALLVQRDPEVVGLPLLLDPEAFADALRSARWKHEIQSVELTYIRYKPATNCIAAFLVRSRSETVEVYAKAHGPDAPMKLRKTQSRGRACPTAQADRILMEDRAIAVLPFPQDEKLRVLSRLGDPARRVPLLTRIFRDGTETGTGEIEKLGYKPERRYVGRYRMAGGQSAVLKFYGVEGFAAAATACRALGSRDRLRLARKCGGSKRHRVLAFEWLPGQTLREVLTGPEPSFEAVAETGAALAELHGQEGSRLTPWRPEQRLAELQALAETLGFLCPALSDRASSLTRRVSARLDRDAARCAIHGDLYDKQILIDQGQVAIVDLDRAALGDPRSDLGLFIAHMERDGVLGRLARGTIDGACEALLDGYQRATGSRVEGLGVYVAEGLLRLAHHPFRSHVPEWQAVTEGILARAEETLAGRP